MSLKETILTANDLELEEVKVPEWACSVYVRSMSGLERDSFEAEMEGLDNKTENIRARLLVRCICDSGGERVFDDADAVDLGNKNGAALDRVFAVAMKHNPIGEEAVADLEKNSDSGQSD